MSSKTFLYHYEATILRIVDGDTVEVNLDLGMKITFKTLCRFSGINAPELTSTDPVIRAAAEKAKEYLASLLEINSVVFLDSKRLDKYGRSLAVITTKAGLNVNDEMVKSGNAVKYM